MSSSYDDISVMQGISYKNFGLEYAEKIGQPQTSAVEENV